MKLNFITIGSRLQKRRKELGMTQEYVAEAIDISVTHLGNIENARSNFSVDVLLSMCKLYKVKPDFILLGTNDSIDSEFVEAIAEKLHLCRREDRDIIMMIINAFVSRNNGRMRGE